MNPTRTLNRNASSATLRALETQRVAVLEGDALSARIIERCYAVEGTPSHFTPEAVEIAVAVMACAALGSLKSVRALASSVDALLLSKGWFRSAAQMCLESARDFTDLCRVMGVPIPARPLRPSEESARAWLDSVVDVLHAEALSSVAQGEKHLLEGHRSAAQMCLESARDFTDLAARMRRVLG